MKTFSPKTIILLFALAFFTFSCALNSGSEKKQTLTYDSHTSKNALDWQGVYRGFLPCADCDGIETRIALKRDGSFQRNLKYLGKSDRVFSDEGEFIWDETGNKITMKAESGDQQYQVGENVLFHLDQEGNRIAGDLADMYKLLKNRVDPILEDKKWMLFELRGKPVEIPEGSQNGHIQFDMETGRFSGNNTCNNYFGQYELLEGNRIKFGAAGTTLMACPDMETQNLFMEVLQTTDNYTVLDNVLSLNKARMAPLARFRMDEP